MSPQPLATESAVNVRQDHHVHTRLCNHASGEMEEYVLAAIDRELRSITFLEHLEADILYPERTWLTEQDFTSYFREGERLRKKYREHIRVQLGVEVGYNPSAIDSLQTTLARYPWDLTGLSYHFLFDGEKHLNMVSRRKENIDALSALGPDRVISRYFDGLIHGVAELDCHVLCHLDAVMRHYPGLVFQASHWEQIDRLLQLMRDKKMLLEVNTSGFTLRNTPYPCRRIVRMAVDIGIPLIAGSDAHRPEQVGRDFDRLPEFLAS
ncbi:MAG: histidinol-phosphatase [Desulfobulbaceae bacterium]|nr:histidinol-phosphatase [Desulfobulbaceae bacterium]